MRTVLATVVALGTIGVLGLHVWLLAPHVSSRTFRPGPRRGAGPAAGDRAVSSR
jgi:hypothetical protein